MNNKMKLGYYLLAGCLSQIATAQKTEQPNIIFILADDIGYSDLGCYGASKIKTPVVDQLASNGIRFTQVYAPASTSSPSRYALLTGEYAWRKNVGILPADAPLSIDPKKMTLPAFLKKSGFQTALIGKWHLGLGEEGSPVDFNGKIKRGPLAVGFDYAYYFPATNDRVPCIYIENEEVDNADPSDPIRVSYKKKIGNDYTGKENPERLKLKPHSGHDATIVNGISRIGWMAGGQKARWKDEEMAEVLLDKAKAYINKHADKPFFLYYAPHNAHEPRVPSASFRGKSAAGIYGDVIEEFDFCVGELVKTLKQKGIYENTIIIISSDNGPMVKEGYQDGALENINGHDPFGNLRGQKYSLHEAGTRVPFIFSWPRKVQSPFVQIQSFSYLDMLATFAGLLEIPITEEECNDSKNGSELFIKADAPLYRDYIIIQNNGGQIAIRKDNWKYIPATPNRSAELYDLEKDPSELHDMMLACPEQAAKLKKYVERDYKR
ncbi:MAG: sulfatase family protein [Parabacteroides gordonii]|uniref:sulfatase family protein n=1 Tax=Parabacteroides gordonii TaxID=574930 RepID=UPI003A87B3D4